MCKKNNGIKVNIEIENLREMINLIRKLKYEVIELKKQGITSRTINKMFKFITKKEKKNQKFYY